jgi:hypothetical protein
MPNRGNRRLLACREAPDCLAGLCSFVVGNCDGDLLHELMLRAAPRPRKPPASSPSFLAAKLLVAAGREPAPRGKREPRRPPDQLRLPAWNDLDSPGAHLRRSWLVAKPATPSRLLLYVCAVGALRFRRWCSGLLKSTTEPSRKLSVCGPGRSQPPEGACAPGSAWMAPVPEPTGCETIRPRSASAQKQNRPPYVPLPRQSIASV